MNIVYLIGNGFDLNCGIKSKYTDMYTGYCNSKSNSKIIKDFKQHINQNFSRWSDFEREIAVYGSALTNERELLECVRDFKKYLSGYLNKENEAFSKKIASLSSDYSVVSEFLNSFNAFYYDCGFPMSFIRWMERRSGAGSDASIINFNYTNTIEILNSRTGNKKIFSNSQIIHIHGDLIHDDIVLGIDDISQLKAKYQVSHNLERGLVKPAFNKEYDNEKVVEAEHMIRQSDLICAFGMSFGITDNTWKRIIIDSMQQNQEQFLVFFDYEMSQKEGLVIDQKLEEAEYFKNSLEERWELEIPEQIKTRILVPCGKNIFNIQTNLDYQLQQDQKRRDAANNQKKG